MPGRSAERWARHHDRCVECGLTEHEHVSRGLCKRCYARWTERRHKPPARGTAAGRPSISMTRAALEEAYLEQGRSLSDLAKQFGCTRQYVFKRLQAFGIPRRTLSQARCAALERGKVVVGAGEGPEGSEGRRLERRHVDEAFFERWSPEMAWVLGVIISDGNLFGGTIRVSQKEPELLEKVRALLQSSHPIAFHHQKLSPWGVHTLGVYSRRLSESLVRLGVTPNKSRTIVFPDVPENCLKHFVRGCWDGDGSIWFAYGDPARPRAHYVSGSEQFMEGMADALGRLGIPRVKVHRQATR